jgi:hypothetical protein
VPAPATIAKSSRKSMEGFEEDPRQSFSLRDDRVRYIRPP